MSERPVDPIIDQACRKILWGYCGLDNYNWLVAHELADPVERARMDKEYSELKAKFLGPYV